MRRIVGLLANLQRQLIVLGIAAGILLPSSALPVIAHAQTTGQRQQLFTAASQEFQVPASVLLAISYNQSRWESHGSQQSVDGGYGLMNLRTQTAQQDGKGSGQSKTTTTSGNFTLDTAARLLQVSPKDLQTSDRQNVRGAAAVLASYGRDLNKGTLPTSVNDWYDTVVKFASAKTDERARSFADDVYTTIKTGEARTTTDGQVMSLSAMSDVAPNKKEATQNQALRAAPQEKTNDGAECPSTLNCRFIPAGYAQNSADPSDYGNYDNANRPHDMAIKYIVIHDTEGSYNSAIDHFQDTSSYVSCNYVIRSSDGAITQMVRNQDVSWCAGDWYVNMHSINIEHEGIAAYGSAWYTEAMYKSSATLVRYLAKKYNIPLDRQHIIGHNNVPTIKPALMPGQHWDPGPYWDWNHYMALINGVSDQKQRQMDANADTGDQKTVTINPKFSVNKQLFSDCQTGTCIDLPLQSSSTVFVRTQPNPTAPLISDKYVHSDGAPGTNRDDDWGDQASYGQRFAWAGQQGNWTAIWYNGQKGWMYNPASAPVASVTYGHTVTPRVGKASIPVYGAAYPEASAYPSDGTVPVQTLQPLYEIPAGQAYATTGEILPTDYFYAWTINSSMPHDHTVIKGGQKYFQITYNHRIGYVLASDVRYQK